jgi:hypothetical protein
MHSIGDVTKLIQSAQTGDKKARPDGDRGLYTNGTKGSLVGTLFNYRLQKVECVWQCFFFFFF